MKNLSDLPWKHDGREAVPQEGERMIEKFGTHWIKYVASTALYLVLMTAGLAALSVLGNASALAIPSSLLLSAALVFVHHWYFHRMLGRNADVVVLTNKRLLVSRASLWIRDDTTEHPLVPMRTVEAQKSGFIQHVLNYGTLSFDVPGNIELVPQPHRKAALISEILQEFGPKGRMDVPAHGVNA